MSQENVEIVEQVITAWNQGDLAWLLAHSDPEIEIATHISASRGKPYVGHHGLREWFADAHDAFAVFEVGIDELREVGDGVIFVGAIRWQGKDSGIEMSEPMTWMWTFRDSKLLRGQRFANRSEALKAVGLEA